MTGASAATGDRGATLGASTAAPARRRPLGPSFGPLPLSCVVVVELGLALAVVLVALDRRLLPVAGVVLSGALLVGLLRRRGRWLVAWIALGVHFRMDCEGGVEVGRLAAQRVLELPWKK